MANGHSRFVINSSNSSQPLPTAASPSVGGSSSARRTSSTRWRPDMHRRLVLKGVSRSQLLPTTASSSVEGSSSARRTWSTPWRPDRPRLVLVSSPRREESEEASHRDDRGDRDGSGDGRGGGGGGGGRRSSPGTPTVGQPSQRLKPHQVADGSPGSSQGCASAPQDREDDERATAWRQSTRMQLTTGVVQFVSQEVLRGTLSWGFARLLWRGSSFFFAWEVFELLKTCGVLETY